MAIGGNMRGDKSTGDVLHAHQQAIVMTC